jgi:hypothetical protein
MSAEGGATWVTAYRKGGKTRGYWDEGWQECWQDTQQSKGYKGGEVSGGERTCAASAKAEIGRTRTASSTFTPVLLAETMIILGVCSMNYGHSEFTAAARSEVKVTLDRQANVLLLDPSNFSSYQAGQPFHYHGGWAKQSPVLLTVPNSGHWHVVVDPQGGAVRYAVQLLQG